MSITIQANRKRFPIIFVISFLPTVGGAYIIKGFKWPWRTIKLFELCDFFNISILLHRVFMNL
jgi:hypothetical protein